MKRAVVTRAGHPADVLVVLDEEPPRPAPGEVAVRVLARPINPADLLLIEGRHLVRPDYPSPVGIEGAGEVLETGEGVGLAVGQRVALPFGGTWAEVVCVPAEDAVPLPDGVDLLQACMLCVNPVTALGLVGDMSSGQWLVHNAANSAVGRLVTRVARARGMRSV
jgi:NADPH:quinone reductase-like Zn-dependent oxidoreductase